MSEEKSKNTLRTVSLVLLVSGILLFISGGVLLLYGMYRNRLWGIWIAVFMIGFVLAATGSILFRLSFRRSVVLYNRNDRDNLKESDENTVFSVEEKCDAPKLFARSAATRQIPTADFAKIADKSCRSKRKWDNIRNEI